VAPLWPAPAEATRRGVARGREAAGAALEQVPARSPRASSPGCRHPCPLRYQTRQYSTRRLTCPATLDQGRQERAPGFLVFAAAGSRCAIWQEHLVVR